MVHHFNYEASATMRGRYIPLDKVLDVLDPRKDDVIMDVGGGDGYYSLQFSRRCRKVIYVDPSERAASIMDEKLNQGQNNIEVLQHSICSLEIPAEVTKIFFSNSFHDIECRKEFLERISGDPGLNIKFVLIEFRKDADIGPPAFIKIGQEELDSIFSEFDFRLVKRVELEKHYISMFSK